MNKKNYLEDFGVGITKLAISYDDGNEEICRWKQTFSIVFFHRYNGDTFNIFKNFSQKFFQIYESKLKTGQNKIKHGKNLADQRGNHGNQAVKLTVTSSY